jgi:hypothetical protein
MLKVSLYRYFSLSVAICIGIERTWEGPFVRLDRAGLIKMRQATNA